MRVILAVILICVLVLGIAPSIMAEEEPWTEGTVTEVPKPRGFEGFGTTPSGVITGRLSYGYAATIGQAQAAFVDLRLQNGDISYGLAGALPSLGASVQPVRYNLYVATPHWQAQWGSESWSVAVTRSISSDVQVRFATGPTWQSAQLYAGRDGWSVVGTYLWQNGLPTAHVAVQFSNTWTWALPSP